jgi:type IV pilus assembly protein PilC
LLTFARQLATMLESGVTLIRSLTVIETQIQSEKLSKTIRQIKNDIEQGQSLSPSLAKHPSVFNQFWVSLIEVGEASGTMPTVLNKLAFYMEQQATFSSTIISGIIYPAILFMVSMGAVMFFALFVGPRFQAIFESMGADLPLITVVFLSTFAFIKKNILLIIGSAVGIIFLFKNYIKTYSGRLSFEHFLYSLPTVGEIYKLVIVERFTSQMAILIDAGVPILYALEISEKLVDNITCGQIINNIKEGVKKGGLLVDQMQASGFFPPMAVQMILVGEETGELSKMLKHVAEFYQENVSTFMKRFSTIIEPFMLVFMGGIIGTIVLAMFLPMFNISQIGGGGGGG